MGLGTSWQCMRVAGIPVRVHWSAGALLAVVVVPALAHPADWTSSAAYGVGLTIALLLSVAAHEVGHGLAARRQGRVVRDIIVSPVGGMTRLEPAAWGSARATLGVFLAGPAMSGLVALAGLVVAWLVGGVPFAGPALIVDQVGHRDGVGLLTVVWFANALLLTLNLVPVPPLDGGRAVGAMLVPLLGEPAASWLASLVGFSVAACLLAAGLLTQVWWLAGSGLLLCGLVFGHVVTGLGQVEP